MWNLIFINVMSIYRVSTETGFSRIMIEPVNIGWQRGVRNDPLMLLWQLSANLPQG